MSFSDPASRLKATARIKEMVAAGQYIAGHTFKVPTKGNPLLIQVFTEMRRRNMSIVEMSRRSGVSETTIRRWLERRSPRLHNLQAVVNTLGWEIVLVSKKG